MSEILEHKNREAIYEYVDRAGRVDAERVQKDMGFDPTAFGHHVTILKRDGLLTEKNGMLETVYEGDFDTDSATTFSEGDVSFSIRPARQADLSGLVGVIREAVSDGRDVVAENIADILDNEQVLFRNDDVQSRVFFVATVDGDVVGWAHLELPQVDKLQSTAQVTVGVRGDHTEQGIGTTLLDRALEWAEANGYRKVYTACRRRTTTPSRSSKSAAGRPRASARTTTPSATSTSTK